MKRYEQGSVGMRPDPEGSWCEHEEAQAEIERLREKEATAEIIFETNKKQREEIERLRGLLRPFAALPVDALGQCQRHPDEPAFAPSPRWQRPSAVRR